MSTGKKRILIVEDEPDIVRGLRDALEFEGYETLHAGLVRDGVKLAREKAPDAILLDLMLPDGNGFEACREIRQFHAQVPIIMLTARSEESDKVRGLDAGADDYVTKPFSVAELLARIKAILRRLERASPAGDDELTIGAAKIDMRKHRLVRNRRSEALTFYEVELLKLLYERRDQPVSRDEILEKIWGLPANPNNRTVDNFIVKLRRKIEEDHRDPRHILTVHGTGYKLVM